MRKGVVIIFMLAIFSTWAVCFSVGHCIYVYTQSIIYQSLFQAGSSFLSSLIVSQYVIEKFVKPIYGLAD